MPREDPPPPALPAPPSRPDPTPQQRTKKQKAPRIQIKKSRSPYQTSKSKRQKTSPHVTLVIKKVHERHARIEAEKQQKQLLQEQLDEVVNEYDCFMKEVKERTSKAKAQIEADPWHIPLPIQLQIAHIV